MKKFALIGLSILGSTYCAIAPFSILTSPASADDRPPRNAKPLSEVIRNLEVNGFNPIVDVDFDDDDGWEVEAYRNGKKVKLKVDPISGRITSERRDD